MAVDILKPFGEAAKKSAKGASSAKARKALNDLVSGNYTPGTAKALVTAGRSALKNFKERAQRLKDYALLFEKQGTKEAKERAVALRKEAEDILKMGSLDKLKAMAYIYTSGKSKLLIDLLAKNPTLQSLYSGTQAALSATASFQAFAKRYKENQKMDAGGVVDIMAMSYQGIRALVNLAQVAKILSPTVGGEIIAWAGVSTGCVSGIVGAAATGTATFGPVGGGVGAAVGTIACAFSFLAKHFSKAPDVPTGPAITAPRTIYAPNQQQMPFVAADGARLAGQLRYTFGIPSWEVVVNHTLRAVWARPLVKGNKGLFPPKPPKDSSGKFQSSTVAVPGFTLSACLAALEAVDQPSSRKAYKAFGKFADAKLYNPAYMSEDERKWLGMVWSPYPIPDYGKENIGSSTWFREYGKAMKIDPDVMGNFGDMPLSVLLRINNYWRSQIRAGKPPYQYIDTKGSSVYNPLLRYYIRDGRSVLRVANLIDYFAAITVREHDQGLNPIDAFLNTQGLPIRQLVKKGGKWVYDRSCWTAFKEEEILASCQNGLYSKIKPGGVWNWVALRALGSIRLRAAMSYINATYWWHEALRPKTRIDMLADLPRLNNTNRGFVNPPDIRHYVQRGPYRRARAKTHPGGHRGKRLYHLRGTSLARLSGGHPAAAMHAWLKGNAARLAPVIRRAERDAILDDLYPQRYVIGSIIPLAPALVARLIAEMDKPPTKTARDEIGDL